MKLTYCHRWSRHGKHAIEPWDESRARKMHEKRKLYTVLIGDPQRPECFIESNMGYFGVEFLDAHLREHLVYQFAEAKPGKLFLQMMVSREYDDEWDLVKSGTAYFIEQDGRIVAEREDFPSDGTKFRREGKVDPSPYWEDYPQFGDYAALVRKRPVPKV
jgi:hypothetical protein